MRRLARMATFGSTLCIALAYASAFVPGGARWGVWSMVVGLAAMVVSLMVLGASRGVVRDGARGGAAPPDAGVRRLVLPLLFTFVVIVGGFGAALLLPEEGPDAPIVLGLPLRAAIVLYGIGLLPMLVLPLAYALTFDELTLREEDLARVRELRARHAESHGRAGP